jgi:Ca2+-binding EF-hand superfamily protein
MHEPSIPGKGQQGSTWKELRNAFEIVEQDFQKFDKNLDGLIDYKELSQGVPNSVEEHIRVGVLSRLHNAFITFDIDQSGDLNFFEYMFLCSYLTDTGSYHTLVSSANSALVKRMFLEVKRHYL